MSLSVSCQRAALSNTTITANPGKTDLQNQEYRDYTFAGFLFLGRHSARIIIIIIIIKMIILIIIIIINTNNNNNNKNNYYYYY